jgi:predicted TIM-barrel fold metal-dependent hydrolase
MLKQSLISADSHVVEPADLWITRMERRFREHAPHIEARKDGDFFAVDGVFALAVDQLGPMIDDKEAGTILGGTGRRLEQSRPGGFDPKARILDQVRDNLEAEIIYPGLSLMFFSISDAEYQRECMRVYNDWLAEFCAESPQRLLGVGMVPLRGSIESAIAEAERCAKLGMRGLLIPAVSRNPSYYELALERFWAALEDIGLPVALHAPLALPRFPLFLSICDNKIFNMQRVLALLIASAVPQRFRKLRFVIVEGGIGWIAALLRFMDHWWEDHHRWMEPKLEEPPSVCFKRQFWATFEDDRAGVLTRHLVGTDRLLWGSDYPHTEGTFPFSVERISEDFSDVPEDEKRMMVRDNTVKLYGMDWIAVEASNGRGSNSDSSEIESLANGLPHI